MSSKTKGETSPFKVLDVKHLKLRIDKNPFSCYTNNVERAEP